MSSESRVFSKDLLKSCNNMALVMGFNRAVEGEFLETLDDNKFYVPKFTMIHEHKAGKACEPHVRCVFMEPEGTFILDVEMGCWDMVPTAETVLERIKKLQNGESLDPTAEKETAPSA